MSRSHWPYASTNILLQIALDWFDTIPDRFRRQTLLTEHGAVQGADNLKPDGELLQQREYKEGRTAFIEKRPPRFVGA